jgi:8-oxo-dGTP pyrophosphatase MutT (NUDIX family)
MLPPFIQFIQDRHAAGLPGRDFQRRMAAMRSHRIFEPPADARKAAVLMLLFEKNAEWYLLLTERVGNEKDPHSNQISFPGGSMEVSDADLAECALRETWEEVGVEPKDVNLIGAMSDLYIPVSNFHVQPFLGWSNTPPQYRRQETEVQRIMETPLSLFQNVDNQKIMPMMQARSFTLKDVPYYDVEGKMLWGATAMMIAELLELLN